MVSPMFGGVDRVFGDRRGQQGLEDQGQK